MTKIKKGLPVRPQHADIVTCAQAGLAEVELAARATAYVAEARAQRTRNEYRKQWNAFSTWCEARGRAPLPCSPETLVLYLTDRTNDWTSVSTHHQALAAISQAHRMYGHRSPRTEPAVVEVMKGIRRKLGTKPNQKVALLTENVRQMIAATADSLQGRRDRAIILIGFAGAFRRDELSCLRIEDVTFVERGMEVTLKRSKTDQEARGHIKAIAFGEFAETCPVRRLREWLSASGIEAGFIFRRLNRRGEITCDRLSGQSIAQVVKTAAARVGLDAKTIGGHSLRAGCVTAAKLNGADDRSIMDATGHRSVETLATYFRSIDRWRSPASSRLGL